MTYGCTANFPSASAVRALSRASIYKRPATRLTNNESLRNAHGCSWHEQPPSVGWYIRLIHEYTTAVYESRPTPLLFVESGQATQTTLSPKCTQAQGGVKATTHPHSPLTVALHDRTIARASCPRPCSLCRLTPGFLGQSVKTSVPPDHNQPDKNESTSGAGWNHEYLK